MAWVARGVAPGYPHHVRRRRCCRQQVFFGEHGVLLSAGPTLDLVGKFTTEERGYVRRDTSPEAGPEGKEQGMAPYVRCHRNAPEREEMEQCINGSTK